MAPFIQAGRSEAETGQEEEVGGARMAVTAVGSPCRSKSYGFIPVSPALAVAAASQLLSWIKALRLREVTHEGGTGWATLAQDSLPPVGWR